MKQLLLRVDDHLHSRLAQQARERGVSVNSFANEILGLAIDAGSLSRTDRLKIKLMALGKVGDAASRARLAAQLDAVDPETWQERIEEARRRIGPRDWIDDLIDEVRSDRLP